MVTSVSLEITGNDFSDFDGSEDESKVCVEKQESNNGGTRLIVSMPVLVDDVQANHVAALLFDKMEQIEGAFIIERVKLASLRFTRDGVLVFKEFLSAHSGSVRHVSLKDIAKGIPSYDDEANFSALSQAFRDSKLEILNLSNNTVGAYMWRNWSNQRGLRQILLDHVEMDEASVKEFASQLTYADTLEDIYVVLNNPQGAIAAGEACAVLESLRNVTSMRWANKAMMDADAKLPWFGLRQLVTNQLEYNGGKAKLVHLVMDGSMLTVSERGNEGLCGALKELSTLKTLKLRDVGLRDGGVRGVTAALQTSQPPLEWLDLSGNFIENSGALAISGLVNIEPVAANIKVLVLERNDIDTDGAASLIDSFASCASFEMDLRLGDNPINLTQIAMGLAFANAKVQSELEGVRNQQQLGEREEEPDNYISLLTELKDLKDQVKSLKEEREVLKNAFYMLGTEDHMDEQKMLIKRLARLEEMVQSTIPAVCSPAGNKTRPSRRIVRRMSLQHLGATDKWDDWHESFDTPPDVSTPNTSNSSSRISNASPRRVERPMMQKQVVNDSAFRITKCPPDKFTSSPYTPKKISCTTRRLSCDGFATPVKKVLRAKLRTTTPSGDSSSESTSPYPLGKKAGLRTMMGKAASERWDISSSSKGLHVASPQNRPKTPVNGSWDSC